MVHTHERTSKMFESLFRSKVGYLCGGFLEYLTMATKNILTEDLPQISFGFQSPHEGKLNTLNQKSCFSIVF